MSNILVAHYYKKTFWFRIFGYGLHITPSKGYKKLFSERYGYTKAYYIGPVRLSFLRPTKMKKAI